LPIGFTAFERLAVLAGIDAAFVARIRGLELAIGTQKLAFDETKVVEEVHRYGHDLVDHGVTDAVAKMAEIILARHRVVQAGELPIASSLVAIVQIVTELGIIDILIHFGGHFEHDKAGRVVAASASGAIVGRTQGAGEAEVQGGADEPTDAAVDIALGGELNGMGRKFIVRQPPA
jgi:hypothetical protein